MLKIKLNNSDEAQPIINHLRNAIASNSSFVIGQVLPERCIEIRKICSELGFTTHFVMGENKFMEAYFGVIIATDGPSESGPTEMAELDSCFIEQPFKFLSRDEATKIWPHETLEDRVIDVSLAAVTGFSVPITAQLFEPGESV